MTYFPLVQESKKSSVLSRFCAPDEVFQSFRLGLRTLPALQTPGQGKSVALPKSIRQRARRTFRHELDTRSTLPLLLNARGSDFSYQGFSAASGHVYPPSVSVIISEEKDVSIVLSYTW